MTILLETGTGTTSSSAQGSGGTGAVGDSLSHHQARVQAAAAAASIYEKSYVYPFANTLAWYSFLLQNMWSLSYSPFFGLENLLQY